MSSEERFGYFKSNDHKDYVNTCKYIYKIILRKQITKMVFLLTGLSMKSSYLHTNKQWFANISYNTYELGN